ncbi:MAG: hypothetical protein K6G72_07475 [Lachnospiraceae bacterium]|nr:hypothetical protein [Lachnospiraceae bacterium]
MGFELTKEDKDKIRALTQEILGKSCSMTYKRFYADKDKGHFENRFVGVGVNALKDRQKKERFFFFSNNEVGYALYTFFANIYNAKHIAKNLYMRDEDEKFTEQFDAKIPLGTVMLPNGSYTNTSVIEIELKVRNVEERNLNFGMPFDIVSLRLVPDCE